jgi:hypothetical protein
MSTPQSTFLVNRFDFPIAGAQEWVIDLEPFNLEGFFSLQGNGLSGAIYNTPPGAYPGSVVVTFAVSNNGVDFVTDPDGFGAILAAITDNATFFASFSIPQCRYLKLIVTANGKIVTDLFISMV